MKPVRHELLHVLSFCLLLGSVPGSAIAKAGEHLDGKWWSSVSHEEQSGFVFGFFDCSVDERRTIPYGQFDEWQQRITAFYTENPAQSQLQVHEVFDRFSRPSQHKSTPAVTGQKEPQSAGVPMTHRQFFDGLYWLQMPAKKRLGFIEGYLSCHVHFPTRKHATFSKSAEQYVRLITHWYHIDKIENGKEEALDDKLGSAYIPDVLCRFRDKQSAVGACSVGGAPR